MADSPFELRLSHAADWVLCPAFVRMNKTPIASVIENAGQHTTREEGTAMHWVAQCIAEKRPVFCGEGAVAPNGVTITEELLDAAELYVSVLHGYEMMPWRIEEQLAAPSIHPKCGGTPDAYGHDLFEPLVVVADLKGGFVPVEVFPNWQLIGYARAILDANAWFDPDLIFEFVIIQPRAYHPDGAVRKCRVSIRDLFPYFDRLRNEAHAAIGDSAIAVSGSQCDNCNARTGCSVAHASAARAMEVSGEPDIHDLPPAALEYEMLRLEDAARMIEARLTGLQAQATHMLRNGKSLKHYAMESGPGRVKWTDEAAAIAMADLLGIDIRKPAKAITPLQASNQLPKDFIAPYSQRMRGEVKLVRFDSNAAVKAFSHLLKKDSQ